MNRLLKIIVLALPLVALLPAPRPPRSRPATRHRSSSKACSAGWSGCSAARPPRRVVGTTSGQGRPQGRDDRDDGRIVDLKEEKIYELDVKKKTTRSRPSRRCASGCAKRGRRPRRKRRRKEQGGSRKSPQREFEFDFDVKETGQTRSIAGYDAREVVMTLTVREKGKSLEESGGIVMTSNTWLGPAIPAMKELADFEHALLEGASRRRPPACRRNRWRR